MAKLKSFEEYIADVDSAEEIENTELAMGDPVELDDEETVSSDDQESGGELDKVGVDGEEAGLDVDEMPEPETEGEEDMVINGEPVDTEPQDKSEEIEDQMEDPENFDNEKVEESEDLDSDDDDDDDSDDDDSDDADSKESKAVADMLKEVYEACKNEAKTWEADMHDEHTLESYMKENAALVASLAMNALKEMKEDMTLEMYEATCEELKESYAKKMDELKEAWTAEGEEIEAEETENDEE